MLRSFIDTIKNSIDKTTSLFSFFADATSQETQPSRNEHSFYRHISNKLNVCVGIRVFNMT